MHFFEAHFVNRIYVTSPYVPLTQETLLAVPRREIADPEKLTAVAAATATSWGVKSYKASYYYVKKVEWHKPFISFKHGNPVTEGRFYVLCEKPSVFVDPTTPCFTDKLTDWLEEWWQTPFLITTSIYSCGTCEYGIANGRYPHRRIIIDNNSSELQQLLGGRCYTIANGLTYVLAMHRMGYLKTLAFESSLRAFICKHHMNDIFQQVTLPWMPFYYGHPTQHIADFPWYYICMGPRFANHRIVSLLTPWEDESFPHLILHNWIALTSCRSAVLPAFNRGVWNTVNETFTGTPDIYGYLLAVGCTRSGWKWWLENPELLEQWIRLGYLHYVLMTSFLLYTNGSDNGQLARGRVHLIWKQLIAIVDRETLSSAVCLVIKQVPYRFMQLLHSDLPALNSELMLSMRIVSHSYSTRLDRQLIFRLNVIYTAFGLGKRKEPFPGAAEIGKLILKVCMHDLSYIRG